MPETKLFVRTATTFKKSGELDEKALGDFLQMFVDAKIGPYVASSGSGEGHALTRDELRRVYRIGVEVCKGKVAIASNSPEQVTARETLEHIMIAIEEGVDLVNIYGPDGRHGYRPSDPEIIAHFDTILGAIKVPAAIAPNPVIGYTPRPAVMAEVARRHRNVEAINLVGVDDTYFITLRDMLDRDIALNVPILNSPITLSLGAAGVIGGEFNIVPKTFRRFFDLYQSGNYGEMSKVYADLKRLNHYVAKWNTSTPRWIKMAMKVLKFPGGEGGLRRPYIMAPDDEVQKFADGLVRLRVPEIDEYARKAGLSVPA